MSIRNVVKVMNFHALIRVDHAKRRAEKYKMMEEQLMDMMDSILNNRNLLLDKKIFEARRDAPAFNIYIGSDMGFCSNYNSQMKEKLSKDSPDSFKILIGRKLSGQGIKGVEIAVPAAALDDTLPRIRDCFEEKIKNRECSAINILYNHYENTTTIYSKRIQVFPISKKREGEKAYREDFAIEGDINTLMMRMISAYVYYEFLLAVVNSRAAENVLRQNTTTESLKKIDELEAEKRMEERRTKRSLEFQKVVDNYVKKQVY